MHKILFTLILWLLSLSLFSQSTFVNSPDGKLRLEIFADSGLFYRLKSEDIILIQRSRIALHSNRFHTDSLLKNMHSDTQQAEDIASFYWATRKSYQSKYNVLNLYLSNEISVEFRLYDYGMAWRFIINSNDSLLIYDETAEFNCPKQSGIWLPAADGFQIPFEPSYRFSAQEDIPTGQLALPPLLAEVGNYRLLIAEANVYSYPGMFLEKTERGFTSKFAAFPNKEKEQFLGRMRLTNIPQLSKMKVKKRENYIARTEGSRLFPFRAVLISESDIKLTNNNLIAELSELPQTDFSWVKPGKVVWDWYHKRYFPGKDFKGGINTETYKYMIDFAAENGIEYINIDDGWAPLHNFTKIKKGLDLKAVIQYADSKQVGVFIWCVWQALEQNGLETSLDYFKDLGVAGLKVDFFDRNDQVVTEFVERLASEAADRKLLLNLHGMYPPAGLYIKYPNVVNAEGVLGLEYNKFSDRCTPKHNLCLPFIRNAVGPMDYTPGGMRHTDTANFKKSWGSPKVMSSRAQQAAMYIVYHGGVQMLADSPVFFEQDSLMLNFIKDLPVSWDETIGLEGKTGEYIAIARRKGDTWYMAGMTAEQPKAFSLTTGFLPEKKYRMQLISDGENMSELTEEIRTIDHRSKIEILVPPLGGFAAKITEI